MARGRRPIAADLLSPLRLSIRSLSALLIAALCAACVGERASEGGAPAVPMGAEPVAGVGRAPDVETSAQPAAATAGESGTPTAGTADVALAPPPGPRPTFVRPEHVRALYLNAWASGSRKRVGELIEVARRTEVNAFVIDVKDASGYVSHRSSVPLVREVGATGEIRIGDLPALLSRLEAEGIYPIARIVIVRDPILAAARPGLAVQDAAGGPWRDGDGTVWVNIAKREVWDYNVALAEEVARMGFPEIQWDYVRFPDAPRAQMASARFPGLDGPKPEAVRAFLGYADERLDALGLDVANTADVFGITTTTNDVGIGQVWDRFVDRVDVVLPMIYPSHYYRGSFGYQRPNSFPYEVVRAAVVGALDRSSAVPGAGRLRPWLQDFDLGPPAYGAPEVRAQIQALYDLGVKEWVLWNAGSRYTEDALQPVEGWKEEPRIRVADRVVPMSQRFAALAKRSPAPDTSRPRVLDPDSLRRWIDSMATGKDTVGAKRR